MSVHRKACHCGVHVFVTPIDGASEAAASSCLTFKHGITITRKRLSFRKGKTGFINLPPSIGSFPGLFTSKVSVPTDKRQHHRQHTYLKETQGNFPVFIYIPFATE